MAFVFISHRKGDSAQAKRLALELQNAGHSVWYDEWEINLGDSIVSKIQDGLDKTTHLILCLSSLGQSEWVDREWMSALSRQMNGHNIKIIPIKFSNSDLPHILADIKYGDLSSNWKTGISDILKAL